MATSFAKTQVCGRVRRPHTSANNMAGSCWSMPLGLQLLVNEARLATVNQSFQAYSHYYLFYWKCSIFTIDVSINRRRVLLPAPTI